MAKRRKHSDPPEVRRERAERIKRTTWEITDNRGKHTFTFGQVCSYFGIKYMSMYNRMVARGLSLEDALAECREDAHTWGLTYSNGTLACGVWDNYGRDSKKRTPEERVNGSIRSELKKRNTDNK